MTRTLLLVFVLSGLLCAHPHMYIKNSVTFLFNDKGLNGISLTWVFDEMFSTGIISDYDKDKNGTFSANETAVIKKEAFSSLAEYEYFSYVVIKGKRIPVRKPADFSAAVVGKNTISYTFTIPCMVPFKDGGKEMRLGVFDKTFYCAIGYQETKPVSVRGIDPSAVSYAIIENTDDSSYDGTRAPEELRFTFRK